MFKLTHLHYKAFTIEASGGKHEFILCLHDAYDVKGVAIGGRVLRTIRIGDRG